VVGDQLAQDPRRGRRVWLQRREQPYPAWRVALCVMMDRNPSSSEVHPVSSRR
jgi:hypothetical protein